MNDADTPLVEQIRQVWKQVLDVDQVGLDDAFFESGGDSLLLIVLLGELNELAAGRQLPTELDAADLFQHSTVRAQAALLSGDRQPARLTAVGPGDRGALLGRARAQREETP